jgi:hypothetical protein
MALKKWQLDLVNKAAYVPGAPEAMRRRFAAGLDAFAEPFLGDVEVVERLQREIKALRHDRST